MVIKNIIKCPLPKTHYKMLHVLKQSRSQSEKGCLNSDGTDQNESFNCRKIYNKVVYSNISPFMSQ